MPTPFETSLAHALISRGMVSERAVAHARALQERGYERTGLGELLLELEHLHPDELARLTAELTGARMWDGSGLDLELSRTVPIRHPAAVALYRERHTLFYATTEPWDETLRASFRVAFGVPVAEPLVASETKIRAAKRALRETPDISEIQRAPASIGPFDLSEAAERRARARWEGPTDDPDFAKDEPRVRLANALLLSYADELGASLRFEIFDEPALRQGFDADFGPSLLPAAYRSEAGRALLTGVSWRFKFMAALEPGPGPQVGSFQLRLAHLDRGFRVEQVPTARGESVIVKRMIQPLGLHPPKGRQWDAYRNANGAANTLLEHDDERAEAALRRLLESADALGADGVLERVWSLWRLAYFLDRAEREHEARPFAERALRTIREHELGPRLEADLLALIASTTLDDPRERAAVFARAEAGYKKPGAQRWFDFDHSLERLFAERASGEFRRALETADALVREQVAWLGAESHAAVLTRAEAAHVKLDLGDAEAARDSVPGFEATARALDENFADTFANHVLGRAEVVAGNAARGIPLLKAALIAANDGPNDVKAEIQCDLALALAECGRNIEAREHAESAIRILARRAGLTFELRRKLENVLREFGPYR